MFADAGYQGVSKRNEVQPMKTNWHVTTRSSKRKALGKNSPMRIERDKSNTSRPASALRACAREVQRAGNRLQSALKRPKAPLGCR